MWEAINGGWLELKGFDHESMSREEFQRFVDWAKGFALAVDGTAYRTMLRNDAMFCTNCGSRVSALRFDRVVSYASPRPRRKSAIA